ncbi:MAG: serine hydrolase [Gemmatimonadota bacterium]|nr:serine hydrolase [Gemmatimonadota bacterium]
MNRLPSLRRCTRRTTVAGVLALAALFPMHAATAQRPKTGDPVAALDAAIAKGMKDWNAVGLAVAIVRNDSVLLAKGYGVRELGRPTAVDADTRFAIGSTTKAMTALALGMLVDEGKVRWDAPVIEYLPAFRLSDPYVTRELTVRDLLTHRAGLGNGDMLWSGADYDADEIFRRMATMPLAYSFRSGFIYQNLMYAVAGEVVRVASGMTWDEFLERRILGPIGMSHTVTRLATVEGQPNVATPHGVVDGTPRVIRNRSVDPVAPAGSVWSSVNDMAKWMRFVLDSGRVGGKALVSPASFREWLSPQTVADKGTYPALAMAQPHFFLYGLGWFLQDYGGQAVAMHTGSIDGMSAIIGLIPDKKLGVYVLANADHVELRHAIMYEVFDRLGGAAGATTRDWSAELLAMLTAQQERAVAAQRQAESRRVTGTRPSLALAEYVGTYRHPTYGDATITLQGDTLQAQFGSAYAGPLSHWQYETFRARWQTRQNAEGTLTFRPDGTGRIMAMQLLGLTFNRLPTSR